MPQKIVFIHGYGKSLTFSGDNDHSACGFHTFAEEISQATHAAFDWSYKQKRAPLAALNPLAHLELYRRERELAHSSTTQAALHTFLIKENAQAVVCHSLGAQLALNTFTRHGVPPGLRTIIFAAADISELEPLSFLSAATSPPLRCVNIFCPWDQALLTSLVMHRRIPAGLSGLKHPLFTNIFYPYHHGPNLHQDIWRDNRFKTMLLRLLADQ
jgi:pimeloyl-ACP methyl ester carboxylesterase